MEVVAVRLDVEQVVGERLSWSLGGAYREEGARPSA